MSACLCVFVHVPCKRKPYMTQLSEPKRLCNYESFSIHLSIYVCVCVHWSWNLQRSEKVATLLKFLLCCCCCWFCSQRCCWSCRLQTLAARERHQLRERVEAESVLSTDKHINTHTRAFTRSALSRIVVRPQSFANSTKSPIGTEIKCQNT